MLWPRHWPVLPTLVVLAMAAVMVTLGLWQMKRAGQKEALIAELRHNPARPALSFPAMGPVEPEWIFRRSSVNCLRVEDWTAEAGRAADGRMGFRYIAHCSTGAEGPGALISVGVADRPDLKPQWEGGIVSGWITKEPDHRSLFARITGPRMVLRPMLIAKESPAPELLASGLPRVEDVPNNHLSYAFQWFAFAALALVIYALALARRQAATPDS